MSKITLAVIVGWALAMTVIAADLIWMEYNDNPAVKHESCMLVVWDYDGGVKRIVRREPGCECGGNGSLWCHSLLVGGR